MVALYRPGPMQHIPTFCRAKHGRAQIQYPHPDLAGILDETYGVIVYQDQVLLIAQKFAGYTLGEADVMRKAMGKKIATVMRAEKERFIAGAVERGYGEADAQQIFDLIEPFAGYAFNKAHAVSYATIAYQTAYLKANYPAEYMTAVLRLASSHPTGAQERIAAAVAECAKLGIAVLPPDVNRSGVNFQIERPDGDAGDPLRAGRHQERRLRGRRGHHRRARREGRLRLHRRPLPSRRPAQPQQAGAGEHDQGGRARLPRRPRDAARQHRPHPLAGAAGAANCASPARRRCSTSSATASTRRCPSLELEPAEASRAEMLAWEKEMLGVYVSEHPFAGAAAALSQHVTAVCNEVTLELAGREVVLAGMVASTRNLLTRDGKTFCAATIEDLSGSVEVTVWPDLFEQTRDLWNEGNILILLARIRERGERLQVSAQQVAIYQAGGPASEPFMIPEWIRKDRNAAEGRAAGRRGERTPLDGRRGPAAAAHRPPRDAGRRGRPLAPRRPHDRARRLPRQRRSAAHRPHARRPEGRAGAAHGPRLRRALPQGRAAFSATAAKRASTGPPASKRQRRLSDVKRSLSSSATEPLPGAQLSLPPRVLGWDVGRGHSLARRRL